MQFIRHVNMYICICLYECYEKLAVLTDLVGLIYELSRASHEQLVQSFLDRFVWFGRRSATDTRLLLKVTSSSDCVPGFGRCSFLAQIDFNTHCKSANAKSKLERPVTSPCTEMSTFFYTADHLVWNTFKMTQWNYQHHSQRRSAGSWGHAAIVEPVLTQSLSQAASLPLHLVGGFPRKGRLQLSPLGAHLLILGLDVILAELAVVLQTRNKTWWSMDAWWEVWTTC